MMVNINVCVTKGRNSKRSPIKRDSSGYVKVNSFISISLFELLLTIFCYLMQCRCRQVDDDISSTSLGLILYCTFIVMSSLTMMIWLEAKPAVA